MLNQPGVLQRQASGTQFFLLPDLISMWRMLIFFISDEYLQQ